MNSLLVILFLCFFNQPYNHQISQNTDGVRSQIYFQNTYLTFSIYSESSLSSDPEENDLGVGQNSMAAEQIAYDQYGISVPNVGKKVDISSLKHLLLFTLDLPPPVLA